MQRLISALEAAISKGIGSRFNPLYHTGAITMVMLALTLLSGLYVFVFYRIGPDRAYDSVIALEKSLPGGVMRSLHRYASDGLLLFAIIHAVKMFLNGRFRGNAALAWISGVLLVGISLAEGVTGYFLVWDRQAQVVARELFRALDVLPIFGEPLSRSLMSQATVSNMLFFIMLFLHVMLAVAILLFIWLHITRVARPRLLPPRSLLYGMLALTAILVILWPARSNPRADLDAIPGSVRLDLFYTFWIPLQRHLGALPSMVLLGTVSLASLTIPFWLRRRAVPAPVVNQFLCTGCRQCYEDCPYDGIVIRPRTDARPFEEEAVVRPDGCARCGVCVGACNSGAIELGGLSLRTLQPKIASLIKETPGDGPKVLVISCRYSAGGQPGALTGLGGVAQLTVPCIATVHPFLAEFGLRAGAKGVLLVGCPEEGGSFRLGNRWMEMRLKGERRPALRARFREAVNQEGIFTLGAGASEVSRLRERVRKIQESVVTRSMMGV